MKLTVQRENLLKPLQAVSGVVERRQTLPILSNVLIDCRGQGQVTLTTTDLEVELMAGLDVGEGEVGRVTVPARKLFDICRALPEASQLHIVSEEERVVVRTGKSRFTLSTLPADDFPIVEDLREKNEVEIPQSALKGLMEKTAFSMAQQDVRYYLNGLMVETETGMLRAVASDGHRLAVCELSADIVVPEARQVIVPRKGVLELMRLLEAEDKPARVEFGSNHIRVTTEAFRFTSKLIDGKFPDYQKVIPEREGGKIFAGRDLLRNALLRTAILSNEKYRGVRLDIGSERLRIQAQNPELEEAEEEVEVQYDGPAMEIGFNVNYLVDALGVIGEDDVIVKVTDQNSSCLIQAKSSDRCRYVVMPMHL